MTGLLSNHLSKINFLPFARIREECHPVFSRIIPSGEWGVLLTVEQSSRKANLISQGHGHTGNSDQRLTPETHKNKTI